MSVTTGAGDIHAIGRRKCSVARLYLRQGPAAFEVNNKQLDVYFPKPILQRTLLEPFIATDKSADDYSIRVRVDGGGVTGQAEAIRLALARALVILNAEDKASLRKAGLITRDPRMVERKKYGKRKARRSFQFSKR